MTLRLQDRRRRYGNLAKGWVLLSAGASSCVAGAQFAPPGAVAPIAPAPVSLSFADSFRIVTDVFVGRNVVGPYVLSWRGIEAGSEQLTRNGQRLRADTDYKLDPKTGILTFTSALKSQQIARIDYRFAPGKALANSAGLLAPMQFNLFERGNGAMSFNALFRPAVGAAVSPNGAGPAALMLLGFNGNARISEQSNLTSKLYLDANGGNLLDRSAVQIAEKSKTSFGLFSAGFTRGGSAYKAADETGIAAAKQALEAQASLNPVHGIAASASFQQTSDLPGKGKGATVTILGQKLSASLGATTKLLATRTDTTTDAPDGTSVSRIANHFQVDQKLGKITSATAVIDHIAADDGTSRSVLQTNSLSVRSQPITQLTLSGTFQNRLSATGAEDSSNIRIEAAPTQRVKLSAHIGDRINQTSTRHQREATVEYVPGKTLSLTGVIKVNAEAGDEAVTKGVSATARPLQFIEVGGGFRLRDATVKGIPDPTGPNTYDVRLSVGLPRNLLKLTGGYANNPEDDKGAVARARSSQMALQSTLGRFDLTGGYQIQEEYLTAKVASILDLKLGWRISRLTQLITSYRETQTQDQGLLSSDTYSLSLTHKVGSLFDLSLSGAMSQQQKDGLQLPNPDYRADVKLGLRF